MSTIPLCPNCKNLLFPRNEQGKVYLYCRNCTYKRPVEQVAEGLQVSRRLQHKPQEKIVVIEDVNRKTMTTTKAACAKCGNNEAYYWFVQTRRADEGSTRFFRCTRCGFTWREYD
ncbi:MAG: transcription factor S [Candidatus Nezhaarchaeales archaeon]